MKGKFNNLTLICVYAPTEANEEVEIDLFYDTLENACDKVNKYDTLLIIGDLNARIEKEEFISSVVGKFSLHDETSPNEQKLCQWTEKLFLRIVSTDFQRKDIYKAPGKYPKERQQTKLIMF